ncbi:MULTISPECIES: N-acetylmuramoyl-L-alanine amidase family protein [Clostridioides]|uniref:N-acetylmuramoyl-L-alanine amidase family protein n=1 Tax=Clostridioides sp. ZZV14-6387 TaxID=2811497 RepID=UPI0007BC7105|nr:N-acetylmuramoyl-L-alanine amidase [Clostridioides sp. ZZV14-6387]MDB3086107.1 N-acetylmuramoyl-L-alanine amidase [Clostridioides difficile]MDI0265914.1 N-acetylmuramoyl-L-alanine amidase [Clostridioides difficile]CZR98275.1 N-acetylmuramoyl-L-alanine amidase LytC precursor [Clostridioides difficile]CZS04295.1 N-acetylmuramoyl-L-alanine amidase LytC precursor [Clostridioides difficile]
MSKSNNNNNSRNKSKNTSHLNRKKRKLNKKKLVVLVCFTMLFLFIAFKVTQGVVALVKGMDKSNKTNQQQNVESEQFDLGNEEENKNKKYTVFIDPGHGGNDKGTQSKTSNRYEKDLNLQISKKLANKLAKQKDIQVVVSRTDDTYVSLMDRVNLAKNSSADVLVSIHLNAEKNGNSATGIETWYRNKATDGSKDLAQSVQSTISSYVKVKDRGIVENNFEVLRESDMPAILIECGFLTTPSEEQKIINEKYQDQLTEGIVQGILSYLDSKGKK